MDEVGFELAGIDTAIFKAHSTRVTASTRVAAVSCAKAKGLPIDVIMKAATWHSRSTFAKYYNKLIITENFGGKHLETSAMNNCGACVVA